jgi:hypothetical protein
MEEGFEAELAALLNRYTLDNKLHTPDFILADYLLTCLTVFDMTMAKRESWYGRPWRGKPVALEG